MMRAIVFGLLMAMTGMAQARDGSAEPARSVLEAAVKAAGGENWLNPQTLVLSGRAVFYAPDGVTPRSTADDYRMWRAMNPERTMSHGADGKVRITSKSAGKLMFEVGYDGETTWTEKGIMPKAAADAYWAANFGFGIIRRALEPGFTLERAPDRNIEGHALDMIRVIDPQGGKTLFGIDKRSRYIRYMGFMSPRGWHERIYDDFVRYRKPDWVQARSVTLIYDGVKANTVFWEKAQVNAAIDPALFAWPGGAK